MEEENIKTFTQKSIQKRYNLKYLKNEKVLLVDHIELQASEITKSLLNDIYTLAGNLQAEELVISISSFSPEKNIILRNLIVFGFEGAESEKYTSNEDIITLSIEVTQEYDFVDIL